MAKYRDLVAITTQFAHSCLVFNVTLNLVIGANTQNHFFIIFYYLLF